ncbi:hypothetical protein EJB05_02373, partial [Eragrostis curvula]
MNTVCGVCGDIGYKNLLIYCRDCKDSASHQYCMDKVIFDGSLADWSCDDCQQKSGENQQVDNENPVHSLNFKQPTPLIVNCLGHTLGNKATELFGRSSKKTPKSLRPSSKGLVKKKKKKVLGSKRETSSSVTVHGNSVLEKGGAHLSSKHTDLDNQANQLALDGCETTKVKSGKDSKKVIGAHDDSDSYVMDCDSDTIRFQLDYRASNELQQRSMAASVPQLSTLQDDVTEKVIPCSPNTCIFKENSCLSPEHIENDNLQENRREPSNLPSEHTENENQKENQSESSNLFDRAYPCSSLETYPGKFLLEDSTAEVEICADLGKDTPRKRRRLILLYDDDEEEEERAEDVQLENVNRRFQNCDTPVKNNETEDAVQTGDSSNSNSSNGEPVKKRRRYIDANEDDNEEAAIDVATACSAQNDVADCARNDGANLELQTAVAENHPLQSIIACNPDTADEQYYTYSRPVDEPVWSGVFKINNEVFGELDAHLSNKACYKVWDLSRMLQPEVEVMKLPRLQAWPKRWTSAAPTDDCIGLFFFPRSSRPNEVSNKLVNEIIESDDALKVTIGAIELLIFPSTLLSEQNHLFQGKYYLWGVFKQRKDKSDRGDLVGEQDGIACATEESKLQEQHLLDKEDGVSCESLGQESSAVKNVLHAENELTVNHNSVAQKVAMKIAEREGVTSTDSNLFCAKPNSRRAESNCSVHPKIDHALEVNQHEEYIRTSPVLNASGVTKQTNTGVTKLTTECDHGPCNSGSEPSTTKLFGLVAVRTPRAQQLIKEMASEGALIFSVPDQIVTTESCTGSSVEVEPGLNLDTDNQHVREHPRSFDFISTGHDAPDVASEACLELFPVRKETIGWAPRAEATKEVDLDLSLSTRSRAPCLQL